jgi:hypothetical protein
MGSPTRQTLREPILLTKLVRPGALARLRCFPVVSQVGLGSGSPNKILNVNFDRVNVMADHTQHYTTNSGSHTEELVPGYNAIQGAAIDRVQVCLPPPPPPLGNQGNRCVLALAKPRPAPRKASSDSYLAAHRRCVLVNEDEDAVGFPRASWLCTKGCWEAFCGTGRGSASACFGKPI